MGGGGVVVTVSTNRISHSRFTNRTSTAYDSTCCRTAHSVFVTFLNPPTPQRSAHSVAYFLAVFRGFLFAEDAAASRAADTSACSDESPFASPSDTVKSLRSMIVPEVSSTVTLPRARASALFFLASAPIVTSCPLSLSLVKNSLGSIRYWAAA